MWALELDVPGLDACLQAARSRLDGLILPRYERQPHVTVAFAGLAAEPGLTGYDDAHLVNDLSRLRPLLVGAVALWPSGWDSFPMVPYLRVDADWLAEAHRVLGGDWAEQVPYVPHVTVGHWGGRWPRDLVLQRLDGPLPDGPWQVSALSLLRYETHDIAGPLEAVGQLDLTTGDWTGSSGH